MSRVTKISLIAVWIAEVFFLPLGQLPWLFSAYQQGWPARRMTEIARDNQGYLIKIICLTFALSNLPDYLSIILYFKMFMLAKTAIQPEIEMESHDEAFGGIWVGEDAPNNEDDNVVQESNPSPQQHDDKIKAILTLLRLNAIFCLLDFASAVFWDKMICQGTLGIIACFTSQNLICFWIPMLVLGINFRKLRNCSICQSDN